MHQTQIIKANGINFNINLWGDPSKPALFLLHGFLDTGLSFKYICEVLSKDYYCIAPDSRGFGKSDHTPSELGYFFFENLADLHQIFLNYSPTEKLKIIGHSMGGNILSLYAGTFPERVSHFVNIEGFGIIDRPAEDGPRRVKKWIKDMSGKPHFSVYNSMDELIQKLTQSNPRLSSEVIKFWAESMTESKDGKVFLTSDIKHRWANPILFQLDNIFAFWQKIEGKCLLIHAENTEMHRWMQSNHSFEEELKKRLSHFPSDSEIHEIKDCGHMLHLEKPKELAAKISSFLVNT